MDKVKAFLERTQTDNLTLANIAYDVWREKLKLEYVQSFGESSVKDLELIYRHLRNHQWADVPILDYKAAESRAVEEKAIIDCLPPEPPPDFTTMPVDHSKAPTKKHYKKKRKKKTRSKKK